MTNTQNRAEILKRLNAAPKEHVTASDGLSKQIEKHYADFNKNLRINQSLIDTFEGKLNALQVKVLRSKSEEWGTHLAKELLLAGVNSLILDTETNEGQVLANVLDSRVRLVKFDKPIEAWTADLFKNVDAGFTVAKSGIASTGSLVLAPDTGTPRTVSLAPSLHISLVYADQIFPDFHWMMQVQDWSSKLPTNLVFATGPTKTSDIQQTLVIGAHGPIQVWVIIVEKN